MNFKRKRSRLAPTHGSIVSMSAWPAWHDRLFHRRPKRRAAKALEQAVIKGADADALAWPVSSNKPHAYYW